MPLPDFSRQADRPGFTDSRLWDFGAGLPTLLLCLIGAAGFLIQIHRQTEGMAGADNALRILSEISSICFLLLQGGLVLIRRLPTLKYKSILPRLWAILSANFSYALVLLPHAPQSHAGSILSSALLLTGTAGSALALIYLGRGFAVLPQARQLTMAGPYRIVRHPLYLFEQLSMFGMSLLYLQPWAFIIAITGFAMQFPRMSLEEAIMTAAFPEYRSYKDSTPRIIPWKSGK